MSSGTTVSFDQCPNCGASAPGAYCGTCGQKSTPLNPSLHEFLHELTHEVAHVDGKIFRTLRLLMTAPGELTRQHLQGRRSSYVPAIRLYLVMSLLYFAATAYAPVLNLNLTIGAQSQRGWAWRSPGEARTSDAQELRRYGYADQRDLEDAVSETATQWVPRVMFVMVPLFAGMVMLVTRRSGRNFPQYLYFALHVHAAWFLVLAIDAAGRIALNRSMQAALSIGVVLYIGVYLVLAIRRAFGTTVPAALWRAAAVGAAYSILVIVAIAGVVVPLVLSRH